MVAAAENLPEAPPRFTESGTDPLSQAISQMLPGIEDPIQEALPKVKTEAKKTANNIVTAAGHYQRTDEQLAANYDAHRFDRATDAGGSGAGAASGGGGGADAMGQMSQMLSMPIQMASQAAQVPMQAMGTVGALPQSAMQGVQQISQMAGGTGESDDQKARPDQPDELDREEDKQESQQGAAPGEANGQRAPGVAPPTTTAVPQQSSGRPAAPDPMVNP